MGEEMPIEYQQSLRHKCQLLSQYKQKEVFMRDWISGKETNTYVDFSTSKKVADYAKEHVAKPF